MIKYNIAIADDHSVAQLGIETALSKSPIFQIIKKFSTGAEISFGLKESDIHILILDMDLPGQNGMDFLKDNRSVFPALKIVLFTAHEGEGFFREAVRLGADGYILKSDNVMNLHDSLMHIVDGKFCCSPKLLKFLNDPKSGISLSERESEVLKLAVNCHTSREIGERIGISRRTAEYYISRLKEKFDAENLLQLAEAAREKYFK